MWRFGRRSDFAPRQWLSADYKLSWFHTKLSVQVAVEFYAIEIRIKLVYHLTRLLPDFYGAAGMAVFYT